MSSVSTVSGTQLSINSRYPQEPACISLWVKASLQEAISDVHPLGREVALLFGGVFSWSGFLKGARFCKRQVPGGKENSRLRSDAEAGMASGVSLRGLGTEHRVTQQGELVEMGQKEKDGLDVRIQEYKR